MSDDNNLHIGDNDLLSNPRAHDHLGEYRCRDCNGTGGFEGIPATMCLTCGKWLPGFLDDENHPADTQREREYKKVDIEDITTEGCMFCGHEDLWFDRSFVDFGAGQHMHYFCSNCGRPQLDRDELVALWERDHLPLGARITTESSSFCEHEAKPSVAFYFYQDDPDSMGRMRRMCKVDDLYTAVQEFDGWLRNRIKYNPDPGNPLHIPDDGIDYLEIAREQLAMRLADYGINIWED